MSVSNVSNSQPFIHKVHPRARSISIRIVAGQVVVTTPRFVPKFMIRKSVENAKDWIDKHLALERAIEHKKRHLGEDHAVMYLGTKYPVVRSMAPDSPRGITVKDTYLLAHPVEDTDASLQKALNRWLTAQAEAVITRRVHALAQTMREQFSSLAFKTQKTRWGSCSAKKSLNFNRKLISAPPEVLDYVVIHELAHLTYMNHADAFWAHVARFDPQYKTHRQWLKKHGVLL